MTKKQLSFGNGQKLTPQKVKGDLKGGKGQESQTVGRAMVGRVWTGEGRGWDQAQQGEFGSMVIGSSGPSYQFYLFVEPSLTCGRSHSQ